MLLCFLWAHAKRASMSHLPRTRPTSRSLSPTSALFVCVADEPLRKPIPLHEQTVKDEKGRYQRFHGAFTGGFSAGYFNTVGTKEGQWSLWSRSVSLLHCGTVRSKLYCIYLFFCVFRLDPVDLCVVAATESREASCQTRGLHGRRGEGTMSVLAFG